MKTGKSELAIVEAGNIFLWSEPNSPVELYSDSPVVGHARTPLLPPAEAICGIVTHIGPEGHASFTALTDVQELIVSALFELRRR
ncbi:MAG: hypothetical protein KJP23_08725 [Deltaproteobacteria bacterium]|nr:hypothetical protein [Deltaproteobacteria bacterium]